MPLACLPDCEIYYEVHGSGTAVLLVPGLGGVASYWHPNLAAFAARHRVIVHDHRGTGQSSRSRMRYSVDQMADDVLRLMDTLGIAQAHLVGHSTGGAIVQSIAITHPERLKSLVIYASWTRTDPFFARVFEARRKLLTAAGAAAYVRATPVFLYPHWWINANVELLEQRERTAIPTFPETDIAVSRIDAVLGFDRTADLASIRTPTLVICAEDDALTPSYFSRELANRIASAQLVLLHQGGHCASEVCPTEFNQAVLGFIERYA
jgi:aminoacrylate hydrolase